MPPPGEGSGVIFMTPSWLSQPWYDNLFFKAFLQALLPNLDEIIDCITSPDTMLWDPLHSCSW